MTLSQGIDIVFAVVTAGVVVRGFVRGLSGEILSLAGVFGGCFLAWRFAPAAADLAVRSFGWGEGVAIVAAMAGIFAATTVAAAVVERAAKAVLRFAHLSTADRFLGAAAGAAKAFAILLLAYGVALSLWGSVLPSDARDSVSARVAGAAWPSVAALLAERGVTLPTLRPLEQMIPDVLPSIPPSPTSKDI